MSNYDNLEKSITNKLLYLKHRKDYDAIVGQLFEAKDIQLEAKKLNGHKHYMLDRLEENILEIIDRNDEVLLIKDLNGDNLTIRMMDLKMEKAVMRAADNLEVVMQYNNYGRSFGMNAILNDMENVALKVLQYPEAVEWQNAKGRNIGMYAAKAGMEKVVLEIIKNRTALLQQDSEGYSIGMYAIKNPKLNYVVTEILKDEDAATQQNEEGWNIGMFAANYRNEQVYRVAKQNPIAVKQVNDIGRTMVDIGFKRGLEGSAETYQGFEIVGE